MIRTLLGLVILVIGIVLIAAGIWGLQDMANDGISRDITEIGMDALQAADDKLAEWTGGTTVTGVISDLTGGAVQLQTQPAILRTISENALVVLLCGIIGLLLGLLMLRGNR